MRWREGGCGGCGGKGAYVYMAVQLAGNVAQIAPLARVVVARDEGRDVDLSHEGPVDEEVAIVEGVERLEAENVSCIATRAREVMYATVFDRIRLYSLYL